MKSPQALILGGGIGKRFWPLKTTKYLFKFWGEPLLAYNLSLLKNAGFNKVLLVTSPETKDIVSRLKVPGISIKVAVQKKPTGMAGAVLAAEEHIDNSPLMIMNATDVVKLNLYTQAFQGLESGKNFVVAKKISKYFDGGYLKLENNKITAIIEKPGEGNQPSNLTNLVFHGFQQPQEFIATLKTTTSKQDDIYEVGLSKLFKKTNFEAIPYQGYWQATKYPWHILEIMDLLLKSTKQQISKNAQISDKATVEGSVVIEDGVKVFENAVIKGPAYIGKNTIVGNGALVRGSMIGDDCVVGYNTEVVRSWVGDQCWFHSNYIGDSVLEENISLGAGAVLANLRLDEAEIKSVVKGERVGTGRNKLGAIIGPGVRIGVNANIMPGIKIGAGSFIGSGINIETDIDEGIFVLGETKLKTLKNKATGNQAARSEFRKKL